MNEPDIIMYSPEQLRYARETLAYRAPEVMTEDERLLLRAATRAPGAPALINPPEVCRAAVDALAASRTPRTTDPAEWARHNEERQRRERALQIIEADADDWCPVRLVPAPRASAGDGLVPAEEQPIDLAPHEVASPVRELLTAVERAADDLHGQGARSDRIALQLLTALARYHAEVGT